MHYFIAKEQKTLTHFDPVQSEICHSIIHKVRELNVKVALQVYRAYMDHGILMRQKTDV